MSLLEQASLIITPNSYKESVLYSVVPNTTLGDMDVVRATTATRVNSAGLIESVGLNIPRIDYTNGSCPSLLVEPQRTNLVTYSEQFDNTNWYGDGFIVTANYAISPSGVQNADLLTANGGNIRHYIIANVAQSAKTLSVFAKMGTQRYIQFLTDNTTAPTANFDLQDGVANLIGSNSTASIEDYGNGWYRCILQTNDTTSQNFYITFADSLTSGRFLPILSSGTIYVWGAQAELGSYATSYIPTVATSITRNADVISKTGISSLIGTEFTLFLDAYETIGGNSSRYLVLKGSGGIYANAVFLEANSSNQIALTILNSSSGTVFSSFSSALTNGQRFKLAVRCKNNDFAYYVNGVLKGSQASGTVPTTSDLYLGYYTDYSDNYNKINSTAIFNTGLTDAECIALTTI
jgi:hypothetical protein